MILTPTNVADVTRGIQELLATQPTLDDVTVERSEEINAIPSRCPWIGVYRAGISYPSRTIGVGAGYRHQKIQLVLLMQHANNASGADCEDVLEGLVQRVLAVLLTDPTLGGLVATLDEIEVQYPSYERTADEQYMQTAALYITAIGGIQ